MTSKDPFAPHGGEVGGKLSLERHKRGVDIHCLASSELEICVDSVRLDVQRYGRPD